MHSDEEKLQLIAMYQHLIDLFLAAYPVLVKYASDITRDRPNEIHYMLAVHFNDLQDKFDHQEIMKAIKKAEKQYKAYDDALGKLGGILFNQRVASAKRKAPEVAAFSEKIWDKYVFLPGKMIKKHTAIFVVYSAYLKGVSIEKIKDIADSCDNWQDFKLELQKKNGKL